MMTSEDIPQVRTTESDALTLTERGALEISLKDFRSVRELDEMLTAAFIAGREYAEKLSHFAQLDREIAEFQAIDKEVRE